MATPTMSPVFSASSCSFNANSSHQTASSIVGLSLPSFFKQLCANFPNFIKHFAIYSEEGKKIAIAIAKHEVLKVESGIQIELVWKKINTTLQQSPLSRGHFDDFPGDNDGPTLVSVHENVGSSKILPGDMSPGNMR
ncbi:hypothetical protein Tco_1557913 [Tanacetum coccineum]